MVAGATRWTDEEEQLIVELEAVGRTRVAARVLTAMISRRYAREKTKLTDILSGHVGLENLEATGDCVDGLLREGLLVAVIHGGQSVIKAVLDLETLLQASGHVTAAQLVASIRPRTLKRFESIGAMTAPEVIAGLDGAIRGARRTIRLVFLTSDANLEALAALEQRARAGVRVQVLLGSPTVVAQLRGASQEARAKRAIESWKAKTRGWPNVEIRVAHYAESLDCPSSFCRDSELLRLDVHEPLAERSLEGEMLVAYRNAGNLIRLYERYFDRAWTDAEPINLIRRFGWQVKRTRWTVAATLLIPTSLVVSETGPHDLLAGAAIAALVAALDENHARAAELWRRVRARP